MRSWEEGLAGLLGGWKGTIQKTSSSGQKSVTGGQSTGEAVPTGPTDRRATPRFRVQFRTVVSGTGTGTVVEGMGTVVDLSLGGCRVEATLAVEPHLLLSLRIYIALLQWPVLRVGAEVQGVMEVTFGPRFLRLRQAENDRLARVIAKVGDEADE